MAIATAATNAKGEARKEPDQGPGSLAVSVCDGADREIGKLMLIIYHRARGLNRQKELICRERHRHAPRGAAQS